MNFLQIRPAKHWITALIFISLVMSDPSASTAAHLNNLPKPVPMQVFKLTQKTFQQNPMVFSQGSTVMLFSEHATQADGVWVKKQLEKIWRRAGTNPVHIWLENAQPALIPDTLNQLETQFPLEKMGNSRGWHDAFASGKLTTFEEKALRKIFDYFGKFDRPLEGLEKTSQPFFREINQAVKDKKVSIHFETPSFEAYREELQKEMMGKMVVYWLFQQNYSKALGALAVAYSYWGRGIMLRDQALSKKIRLWAKENPKAITIVVRGLAHESTMKESFLDQKTLPIILIHKGQSSNHSDLKKYLLQYHQLPSLETSSGQNYLLFEFFKLIRSGNKFISH